MPFFFASACAGGAATAGHPFADRTVTARNVTERIRSPNAAGGTRYALYDLPPIPNEQPDDPFSLRRFHSCLQAGAWWPRCCTQQGASARGREEDRAECVDSGALVPG